MIIAHDDDLGFCWSVCRVLDDVSIELVVQADPSVGCEQAVNFAKRLMPGVLRVVVIDNEKSKSYMVIGGKWTQVARRNR